MQTVQWSNQMISLAFLGKQDHSELPSLVFYDNFNDKRLTFWLTCVRFVTFTNGVPGQVRFLIFAYLFTSIKDPTHRIENQSSSYQVTHALKGIGQFSYP